MTRPLAFCGETVTTQQLELITGCVARYPNLSLQELANTLCEWLDWYRPNGHLKTRECRELLQRLHQREVVNLPPLRKGRPKNARTTIPTTAAGDPGKRLETSLSEIQPIAIRRVTSPAQHQLWRELVGRHHYLGYRTAYGASVRYLIENDATQQKILGCLQFSSPAWRMKARDDWIGWNDTTRKFKLQRVINNSRFLLLPWVHVPNLASHVLALALRTVVEDWTLLYGNRPWLVETLVDCQRYTGHCYKAANWINVGLTTGRGRDNNNHLRRNFSQKSIFLRPLVTNARRHLAKSSQTEPEIPLQSTDSSA